MSDPALLEVQALHKSYASGPRRLEVLHDLDLTVEPGESVAIVGDSGVGKSTLLHLLGGLDRPDSGVVRFRGREIHRDGPAQLARFRNRQVGFVFQFHHLLPEFTALENVEMPFRIGRVAGAWDVEARRLLEQLGLEQRLHHTPGMLSGGEQQRVAVARALATRPALMLADEPTGNLDPSTGREVFGLIRSLQRERGFALLMATHSAALARGCSRILRLAGGRLVPLDARQIAAYFEGLGAGPVPDPML